MNRQQRRQAFKDGSLMPVQQARQMAQDNANKVLKKAVADYSAVVALCLRDRLGFGHKRAAKFLSEIGTIFQDVYEGRLSIEDIKLTLDEEIGIRID